MIGAFSDGTIKIEKLIQSWTFLFVFTKKKKELKVLYIFLLCPNIEISSKRNQNCSRGNLDGFLCAKISISSKSKIILKNLDLFLCPKISISSKSKII